MAKQAEVGSVAPRRRVNLVYSRPDEGGRNVELPLKLVMLGDYTLRPDERPVEDRETVAISADSFDEVLKAQDLSLSLSVPNRLSDDQGGEIAVNLKFSSMRDFEPDSMVEQVPQLKQVLELRKALLSLKGPLGDMRAFKDRLREIVDDEGKRKAILDALAEEESRQTGSLRSEGHE